MRHGVVRMDDVEAMGFGDACDRGRQREQVLRLAKERIRRGGHLVEEEAFLKVAEPERPFRADEVHLMAAKRQRLAQLGR